MPSRSPSRVSPLLLILVLVGVYVFWGSTIPAMRVTVQMIPAFLMASVRFLIAGAVLWCVAMLRGSPLPTPAHWRTALVTGFSLILIGNGIVAFGLYELPAGLSALLVGAAPVWMVLLGYAIDGERIAPATLGGVVLGLLGIAVLVTPHPSHGAAGPLQQHAVVIPALLTLAASVSWAFGSIYQRRAPQPDDLLLASAMQMLVGGVFLGIAALATGELSQVRIATALSPASLAAMLYLIVFGAIGGFSCYLWLLRHASTALAATYAYVNPLVAMGIGATLLHERITPQMALSTVIILVAVALIMVKPTRRRVTPAHAACCSH